MAGSRASDGENGTCTRIVFKWKLDGCGRVEKYKCGLVARGFRFTTKNPLPRLQCRRIRMLLEIVAVVGWEARQLGVDIACIEDDVK